MCHIYEYADIIQDGAYLVISSSRLGLNYVILLECSIQDFFYLFQHLFQTDCSIRVIHCRTDCFNRVFDHFTRKMPVELQFFKIIPT